jgi:hypothetical protein
MDEDDEAINNTCYGCGKVICLSCEQGDMVYEEIDGHTFCADCREVNFVLFLSNLTPFFLREPEPEPEGDAEAKLA